MYELIQVRMEYRGDKIVKNDACVGGAARVSKHCQGQSDLFFAGCGFANNLNIHRCFMFLTKSIGMQDSMGRFFRKDRTSRLRAFRIHLLIVLLCTLILFASNVVSLHNLQAIQMDTPSLSQTQAHREMWFVGIAIFMFLCVLAIGLFLFVRVTWDIRWFEVRSGFVSGVSHEFKTPLSLNPSI